MKKLAKLLFAIFLVGYFLFYIVANIPAKLVANEIVKAVPNLHLGVVSGTAWRGRAGAATVDIPGQTLDLGGVRWKVDVPSLLGLRLCMDVDTGVARGHVCRGMTGTNTLQQFIVDEFPVSLLNNIVGAELGGVGEVTVRKAVVNDKGHVSDLDARMTWMRARGNGGGGWFPLGSFAADLTANGSGGVKAQVVDVDGEFEIKIDGEIGVNQLPKANGIIKPRENAPQALVDTLMVFTEVLDDGSYKVTWPIGGG